MLQDLSLLRKTDYLAWKIWFKKNLVFFLRPQKQDFSKDTQNRVTG